MRRRLLNNATVAAAFAVAAVAFVPQGEATPARRAARPARPPKLAVVLMVDQMRADYVDRFKADWSGGLKRLVTHGAWFRQAAYPYMATVTCAGHATVSSGAFPHTHGVIQNAWWDRDARKQMTCTEDPKASDIGYGAPVKGGDSAYRLEIPSFADEMRSQRAAHVVTLALKDRSAIMLAGHGGDAVTWLSSSLGEWQTSSAFGSDASMAVKAFVAANPIDADYGKIWSRLMPEARYTLPDEGVGEMPPKGWTKSFPHELKGKGDKPDADYYHQWELSPYADAYVGRFAASLVEQLELGHHDGTDVLAISFSTPDLVGHAFGPRSQEVQDVYAQLDRTIGALLDRLDALVGRGQYVVGLTADHGVTPIPEQLTAEGKDAGRLNIPALAGAVEDRLEKAFGPGQYVNRLNGNDLYFEAGVYEKLQASPAELDAVMQTLAAAPGVQKVFRSEQVRDAATSADPVLRAAALSYYQGRSGDLIVALKPGWIGGQLAATHGSANWDDQHVPILLMGRGVRPGVYTQHATPADVTPTLAALCGIGMPKAEGRVLREALTVRRSPHTTGAHPATR